MLFYMVLGLGLMQILTLVILHRVYDRQTLMLEQLSLTLCILAVAHEPALEAAKAAYEQAHARVAP